MNKKHTAWKNSLRKNSPGIETKTIRNESQRKNSVLTFFGTGLCGGELKKERNFQSLNFLSLFFFLSSSFVNLLLFFPPILFFYQYSRFFFHLFYFTAQSSIAYSLQTTLNLLCQHLLANFNQSPQLTSFALS